MQLILTSEIAINAGQTNTPGNFDFEYNLGFMTVFSILIQFYYRGTRAAFAHSGMVMPGVKQCLIFQINENDTTMPTMDRSASNPKGNFGNGNPRRRQQSQC